MSYGLFLWSLFCLPIVAWGSIVINAGPEIYYFERNKQGGTHQSGRMDGLRLRIERLKENAFYFGIDAFWAEGDLKGRTGSQRPLSSQVNDWIYEGRVGYTLVNSRSFFTPFGGYGHFHEKNAFFSPSPIPFTFNDTFNYFAVGFLSGLNFTPLLSMGFNFELKFMKDGKSCVSDDPLFENVTLIMNDEMQARVELPLTYSFSRFYGELAPFYEWRHFGGREGFPFDFIDTTFQLIGVRLSFGGCF